MKILSKTEYLQSGQYFYIYLLSPLYLPCPQWTDEVFFVALGDALHRRVYHVTITDHDLRSPLSSNHCSIICSSACFVKVDSIELSTL